MGLDIKKEQNHSSAEEKKKVLWDIFVKLEKASLGCGELDLPLFGEILLKKCEPDPDYNIYLAKHICKKLIQEAN